MTVAVDTVAFAGCCWRAMPAGRAAMVLDGTVNAGRYNRPGERTLYMSGSPEGVAAAMTRYATVPRVLVRLRVVARRLIDLRTPAAWTALGVDPAHSGHDWQTAIQRGEEPPSWQLADHARALDVDGLIDGSRHLPGAFHVVLFGWNAAGAASVAVETP